MFIHRLFFALLTCIFVLFPTSLIFAQTHLIFGGEDEDFDAMVLSPNQIEEGPDGNLYILDAGDSSIKVYSPAGEFLRKLAGPGQGPGEIQRGEGSSFGFTSDGNLFITEYFGGHRWLTIMDLNGELICTLSPQLKVNYGIQDAVSLDDGSFLIQFSFSEGTTPTKNYFLYNMRHSLVLMDSQGSILNEIVQTEHPTLISYSPTGGTSGLPYTPLFTWVCRHDNTIIWGDGMSSQLETFDLAGNSGQKIDTMLPPSGKVTRDDLKSWCRDRKELVVSWDPAWWQQFGRVVEDYDKSLYDKPVLQRITNAPLGHFLIEGTFDSVTDTLTYWIFDEKGRQISAITTRIRGLKISANYLLYLSQHEDGNVFANAVKWSGSFEEALSLLDTLETP